MNLRDSTETITAILLARTGSNPRYFGQHGRGMTWLNYVNDQVTGLGGIVVIGTVRDEDLARISPLGWRHVNIQRRYRPRRRTRNLCTRRGSTSGTHRSARLDAA
ncbi:hypothetical protein [Actinopolyspora mortivallis]|uniref:Uncharacterized protein n=1 Tax=Actinopolyspora mortivallis TaxID=33906 RepID=A0A2T0GRM2_ACTMO|nr:hypothetical protein [Actinopolyspora mortivallis]PRW61758.1 hypothetical protein CEP50_19020 [Actinopolyspora mortivallis]